MNELIFSERLRFKLPMIREAALSAIEAPTGYGKTTAVLSALESLSAHWYIAVESLPDNSFTWFLRQLGTVDKNAEAQLRALGYPNRSNAAQAAQILMELRVEKTLFLVFDNFQFAVENWPPQLFDALVKRRKDGLHTIFISQSFGRIRSVLTALEHEICYVRGRDLLLSEADIAAAAACWELNCTPQQLRLIRERTGGWAVAVSLMLQDIQQRHGTVAAGDLNDLLTEVFWQRLPVPEREALLQMSLFDCLRESRIPELLGDPMWNQERVHALLYRMPLARFQPARSEWYFHDLLLDFLKRQLQNESPERRREIYTRAGDAYCRAGQTKQAVECFFAAEEYDKLLSCHLVCLLAETFCGRSYPQLAESVLQQCPEDILRQHPLSVLRLCYALYGGTKFDQFELQITLAEKRIALLNDPQMMGEWHLVAALRDFPELAGMEVHYLKAQELMKEPSQIFTREEPFLFGCPSMWYLFYTHPGEMLHTADRLAEVLAIYDRVTGGHSTGAAELYLGEALSVQGRFEESDIQAHKAAFLSEQYQNATVTYGAALLLGINAIYRSDMVGLQKAVDYLENKAQAYPTLRGTTMSGYMAETVRGYLLGLMMEPSRSALWAQGSADALTDLNFTNFLIKTCRVTDLLLQGEYSRAIASVEATLQMDPRLLSAAARNFMYCGLALCYLATGRIKRAAEYLEKSLTLAEQDRNYTFLACFRKYFSLLFLLPQIARNHSRAIREISDLDIRYTRANESRIFAMLEDCVHGEAELTEREQEIARLAAQGLHNNEIAAALHISENTVKSHLKTIFQKMNIDRRSKLVELLK